MGDTEVNAEKKTNYIGANYNNKRDLWCARRWSKKRNKMVSNGSYKYEKTAALASDTLARKLMENGEKGHKLNFPDDHTEVYQEEKRSNYIGAHYSKKDSIWCARRWSKKENKMVYNGCFKYERTAAHASDTLARKLMSNGEKDHKLNFPDDNIEEYTE